MSVPVFNGSYQVFDLTCGIDISKSSGPDGISAKMLRATAVSITPAIIRLFNMSITSGELPADWKLALVGRNTVQIQLCPISISLSSLQSQLYCLISLDCLYKLDHTHTVLPIE